MSQRNPNNIFREVTLPGGSRVTYRKQSAHEMGMHCHDAIQAMIPLEQASFELTWGLAARETDSKPLSAGDIVIIPPLLEHSARWTSAHFVNIYIPTRFIYEATGQTYDKDEQLFTEQIGINDAFIYQIGATIRQQFLMHEQDNYKFFDAILVVLSNYLLNNCSLTQDNKVQFNGIEQIPCEKIRSAISHMSTHLDKALAVEEVAKEIGMSQYHFMRTFKETVGTSPAKFHTRQRIDRAKELLGQNLSIVDIAYELGFSSQSHFSNVFSKSVGITPKKFQQHASQQ